MTLLTKPSRSYAGVEHDPNGLSPAYQPPHGNGASGSGLVSGSALGAGVRKLSKKDSSKVEGGFKTYRPPLAETHLRRPLGYDPHPDSKFAPLPPAFHLSGRHKKETALAGQRAELDHILQPEYKSSAGYDGDNGDGASVAGPSRHHSSRTAGGLSGLVDRKGKNPAGSLRPSASIASFHAPISGGGGRRSGGLAGVYVDSSGKLHDTEFDPFGHVSEMSRAKSRRRSAFGADRRKGSDVSSSSESGSEAGDRTQAARKSIDANGRDRDREEEEIKRRLEMERKRLDDVSGYAAARRRSMMSERSGRATPSIRSSEDGPPSFYSANLGPPNGIGRSRSQQGQYIPSPLSPTFSQAGTPSIYSSATSRTAATPHEAKSMGSPAEKTTESTAPPRPETKSKVEVHKDGSKKITGFDAPISPVPLYTPSVGNNYLGPPTVAESVRLSAGSRASSDMGRDRPPKPAERPREELFPETPAQAKRREEREKRTVRPGITSQIGRYAAIDTVVAGSGKGRILPEIEIVEDDDPRIIIPNQGKSTRVQTVHDHVIRGPFGLALEAQGISASEAGVGGRRASSSRSVGGGSKPSTIFDEDGGYLPSRWANGDKALRVTEDERERYRPMEWAPKHGETSATPAQWHTSPSTKDQLKRNMKDIATSARFSLFRAKKTLMRKADM
ncbi:hypothetical protein IAU60_000713 [Kwoniella sp. DSM 27419]